MFLITLISAGSSWCNHLSTGQFHYKSAGTWLVPLWRLSAVHGGFGNELERIYQWEYNMCLGAAVFPL